MTTIAAFCIETLIIIAALIAPIIINHQLLTDLISHLLGDENNV